MARSTALHPHFGTGGITSQAGTAGPGLPRFLTVREAAGFLHISPYLVYRLIEAHPPGIPHFRIRSKVLFDVRELEAWISRRTRGGDE